VVRHTVRAALRKEEVVRERPAIRQSQREQPSERRGEPPGEKEDSLLIRIIPPG